MGEDNYLTRPHPRQAANLTAGKGIAATSRARRCISALQLGKLKNNINTRRSSHRVPVLESANPAGNGGGPHLRGFLAPPLAAPPQQERGNSKSILLASTSTSFCFLQVSDPPRSFLPISPVSDPALQGPGSAGFLKASNSSVCPSRNS